MDHEESFFHELADQTADQAQLLLGLDQISTEHLINEIKNDGNLQSKYSKLFHILINRLTVLSQPQNNYPNEFKQTIKTIRKMNNQTPTNPKEFLRWIPSQFELFTTTISSLQSKFNDSKRKLNHILKQKEKKLNYNHHHKEYNDINTSPKKENEIKTKKSLECDKELTNLKQKYQSISSQVAELKQALSKTPVKEQILQQKLTDALQNIDQLREENDHLKQELKLKSDYLDQEKLMNIAREKKFNEIKQQLANYGNELMKKEKELKDSITSNDVHESLRLQINSLSDHLTYVTKEKDLIENNFKELESKYNALNEENDTLKAQCSVLQNESIIIKKDHQALLDKVKRYEMNDIQLSGQIEQNDLIRHSVESKLKDSQNECNNLKNQIDGFKDTINKQSKEIVRLETNVTKAKDELYKASAKLNQISGDSVTLQRYGFMLADAVCQHYNPKNAKEEIERLLDVVRSEHIQLSETARVKLNPFQVPINNNSDNKQNPNEQKSFQAIHSKFDELDKEFASLALQQLTE
ncbi:hypothetical protein TRFO_02987 [Tritrichomonas foetus]|uniref:Uncharacterized protein n=1 Tax=Tritrichomonas foetus TaxID=1144522 RepID=A0A1J4KUB5_9EUKA|nr:hypothetical protein TRFO_02987 [Tritrichomonas foetus]|eukprot:OHT14730.1 hypothetical protein TRFO_02987 [Tritrichomonas foetus]